MTRKQDALLLLAGVRILLRRLWHRLLFWRTKEPLIDWREAKVLCLGLDNAGKSSIVRRASDMSATSGLPDDIMPTTGFNVRTVTVPPDCKLEVWDIGGGAALRPFWYRYATWDVGGLIWVVDPVDTSRLPETATALANLLEAAPMLRKLPLLVLLTKADLTGARGADSVVDALGLAELSLGGGLLRVQAVSAVDGRELMDALRWLAVGQRQVSSEQTQ